MKRRGGKREGAGRKESPALTKIKALESKSPLYIFGKSVPSVPGGKVHAEGTFVKSP